MYDVQILYTHTLDIPRVYGLYKTALYETCSAYKNLNVFMLLRENDTLLLLFFNRLSETLCSASLCFTELAVHDIKYHIKRTN